MVFCGTAAGNKSAQVGFYYASPNNKFWSAIHQVGLTPLQLKPNQYMDLLKFNLGLTDLVKEESLEASLRHDEFLERIENLRNSINRFSPLNDVTEELLHHFVERIEVDNRGIPKITYRFSILPN
ncbi:hypothetical protein CN563_22840 [Bacillus sp. AFS026049]|nr:hypothetical protein CN563_22840 [Bacillus sp. AFS026049]